MNKDITITVLGVLISILALGVSGLTLWLSHLRQGQILMTKPTIFFFGWDDLRPKIFLRTLLFSTSTSGRILENMYLLVRSPRGESVFSFWGHTKADSNSLDRGSGLFVGKNGFLANHHFNPDPSADLKEPYPVGEYEVEVIARQFGETTDRKLGRYVLQLNQEMATSLKEKKNGVLWTLNPRDQTYFAEFSHAPERKIMGLQS